MLASNVADYLEFKAMEGLYWLEKGSSSSFELSPVPCSKNDVFGTRLLQPMDKRRLMKFIQVAMDYATKMSVAEELQNDHENATGGNADSESSELQPESEVQSLNERHLNQGRSLARPQNKAVATNELQILEESIEQNDVTFDAFLSQQYKLSPKLRSIVRYALAWETGDASSTSLKQGMASLRQHLQALGRYGTTAFLVPMYGSGELSQAFCRSAAVFGATYLLRRAPLGIQCNEDNGKVRGVLISGCNSGDCNVKDKIVKCKHAVVPVTALLEDQIEAATTSPSDGERIVRRLVVLQGKVIPSESGEQRHFIFIPPDTIGNTHAIHAVLLDFSARASPNGCTLMHLTTTVSEHKSGIDDDSKTSKGEDAAEVLQRAQESIIASKRQGVSADEQNEFGATELYHVSFSSACPKLVTEDSSPPSLTGMHLCPRMGQSLTADAAFEEARRLFSTICPGMEFLGLASTFDEAIRERAEEKRYEDDEKTMLESALGMIDTPPSPGDEEAK